MKLSSLMLFFWASCCLFPIGICAQEVKIFDPPGLIRALSTVSQDGGSVVVRADQSSDGSYPDSLRLTSTSGLAEDHQAPHTGEGVFRFERIPAGSWKILSESSGLRVLEVYIENH